MFLAFALCFGISVFAQTATYPESQLNPAYGADSGAANVLAVIVPSCPSSYGIGNFYKVLPGHANTTTTPTLNVCGLGAKTIVKINGVALAANDLNTSQVAEFIYDGTYMELLNPLTNTSGTISAVNATSPLTGGGSSGSVTVGCATCVTSSASLGSGNLMTGAGSQASQTNVNDTLSAGGIFTLYDNITTAGLGIPVVEAVSDVTGQTASQSSVNLVASTGSAGHYIVKIYIDQNALCTTGTGNVYATVSWTDASHAHTATTVPLNLITTAVSSPNGYVDATIPLWSAVSDAISYTTTYTACTTGTASYDLHAELERTN